MDAGSCVSAPGSFPFGFGRRSGQLIEPVRKQQQEKNSPNIIRSPSVAGTDVSTTKSGNKPRMAHLETLEAKVSNNSSNKTTHSLINRSKSWECPGRIFGRIQMRIADLFTLDAGHVINGLSDLFAAHTWDLFVSLSLIFTNTL